MVAVGDGDGGVVGVDSVAVGVTGVDEGEAVGSNDTNSGYEISAPGVRYDSAQAMGVSSCGISG